MRGSVRIAIPVVLCLAGPVLAKDKVVRLKLGPFRVEAKRDREVCQAVRVPRMGGMEVVSYDVRSRISRAGHVGSHHMVVYGYRGADTGAFRFARNAADVVDSTGCNDFGPGDFFRNRVQIAGSGGEFVQGKWALTRGATPLGLASLLPGDGDAVVVLNSHYFNTASGAARGYVRVTLRLRPYDGTRRVVRNVVPLDASYDIDVPPGDVRESSGTWQADGGAEPSSEDGVRPDRDVCVLLVTTHTHKRGTHVKVVYEEDGKEPEELINPVHYDYLHPPLLSMPLAGPFPRGNLLRAYTAENGHPRLRYTCTHANGAAGVEMKTGCEATAGVTPGVRWSDALGAGEAYGHARPCGEGGTNCSGFGTDACVAANLVFGPLSDDEMCIIPMQIYEPTPGAPPETACNPYAS